MHSTLRALGYLSRHSPKGKVKFGKAVRAVVGHCELEYRDQWGYTRLADLHDEYDALGFAGDPRLPRHIGELIQPGDWVLDVGANVGLMASPFCHRVGPEGEVWAIEPLPRNVRRLEYLKERNHLPQLRVFPGALGRSNGVARMSLPPDGDSGLGSLVTGANSTEELDVSVWSLDDLVSGNPSPRTLRLVKLDVEGFEPEVLAGGRHTLRSHRPLVYCEFNDPLLRKAGSSARSLLGLFDDLGYEPVGDTPDVSSVVLDLLLEPTR